METISNRWRHRDVDSVFYYNPKNETLLFYPSTFVGGELGIFNFQENLFLELEHNIKRFVVFKPLRYP